MITGELKDLMRGRNGEWIASFSTRSDITELFDDLSGKEVSIEIKKHSKRRSLEANAYCWVLVDKIAEATGLKKVDVYRHAIKEIGGVSDIVCVMNKGVERLRENWERNGIGWQTDTMPSKRPGCTNVILYYGSSTYDTTQMSHLLQSLVQDAEALGISTITPKEMERMLGNWATKHTEKEA